MKRFLVTWLTFVVVLFVIVTVVCVMAIWNVNPPEGRKQTFSDEFVREIEARNKRNSEPAKETAPK